MAKLFASAACAAVLAAATAASALAGEATGNFGTTHGNNSKTTPIASPNTVAHSICAFSGQNPERFATGADFEPGRTQSYGQVVKSVVSLGGKGSDLGGIPGTECNGHTGALSG